MPAELEDPELPGPPDAVRFREAAEDPRPLPSWWTDTAWPLVYLTFGSVAPTAGFFPEVYRAALDALAPLPVRVLLTVGRDRDPRELGPLPKTCMPPAGCRSPTSCHRRRRWSATARSGTVRAGLAAGIPMAVVPLFADQFDNAQRVARWEPGSRLTARPGSATPCGA